MHGSLNVKLQISAASCCKECTVHQQRCKSTKFLVPSYTFITYALCACSCTRVSSMERTLSQCFSTFVRPRPGKFFWHVYVLLPGYFVWPCSPHIHRTEFVTSLLTAHFTVPSSWRHTMNKKKAFSSIFTTDTRSWSIPDWGVIL
jgi:hypothetical protein